MTPCGLIVIFCVSCAAICFYIPAILYLGRAVVFLVANTIFALVYLKARKYTQDQALNKMWINIWHVGVASNMGAVAVYALNDEFQSILRETKNGMTGPMAYALAKSVLVIPIILIFSVFALGIPSVLIMDFPGSQFGAAMLLWSALLYVFECCAECFSVWLEDPILGMLGYTSYWFGFFLFSGFVIGVDDLVYPFKIFYYVFPFSYYIRSQMYNWLSDATWVPCYPDDNPNDSPICQPNPTGASVLKAVSLSYPVIQAKDTYWQDFGTLIALALVFKVAYVVGVYMRTSRSAMIHPNSDFRASQVEGITASSSKAAEVGPSMSGSAPSSRYLPPGALEIISGEMSEQLQDRVAKFRDYVQVEL
jgi:ABC-2 type transporter